MTLGNSAAQVLTIFKNYKKSEQDYIKLLNQKDEFLNILSHELKTPITTIKGYSQILSQTLRSGTSATKSYVEKINNQADKLTRLINDLLDVSRIKTNKLIFENKNFELDALLRQTIDSLKIVLPSHSITFKSDSKIWVKGDSHRIGEVIINLINNAAKYSPPRSKIKVCLKSKDNKAYVEIEDFGYGITEKDQSKIFNRLFQSKGFNKSTSGLGLGLYIANSIIKQHGGNLGFQSKKTKGTIFYFTIPLVRTVKKSIRI